MEINNEKEIWRDIKGFEDLYKVNNKGIVISKKTNTVKTPYVRKVSGSLYIGLNRNERRHLIK
jgi:hypothetical protein